MTSSPQATRLRVRPFQDSDAEKVRELFWVGIAKGAGSAHNAVIRGSLFQPHSLLAYLAFVLGLTLACTSHTQTIGRFLYMGAMSLFLYHQWNLSRAISAHADRSIVTDLSDVGKHYQMAAPPNRAPSGPNGFWVAEIYSEDGSDTEVVGCVGLDNSVTPDPKTAELRRIAVSNSFHRRGIGRMLIETALAHARQHRLTNIILTTTAYQTSAVRMYEKFGWVKVGTRPPADFLADLRLVDYRLDLV